MPMPRNILITMMMLGGVSSFIFGQETPATDEQNTEQTSPAETEQAPDEAEQAPAEKPAAAETAEPVATETAQEPAPEATEQNATEEQLPVEENAAAAEQPQPTEEAPVQPAEQQEAAPAPEAEPISIPAAPAPIEEQEIIIPDEIVEQEEPAGIDTVSLENPQGNWLFKRIWWERAEDRYEKIRQLVDAIWDFRTKFFIARNDLDRNVLDPFYINIGIDQGELEVILGEINEFLEKQSEREEDLTEDERMLYQDYVTQEDILKQLRRDVNSIGNLDRAIDQALGTLMDQINRVRQYESDAWKNFREIAHILNDTKARELYYMIEGAARNIKGINTYLEREFFTHFNKLVSDATQQVNRVQNQIEALKEKGIRFQRQTDIFEEQKRKAAIAQEEENEEEEVAPKPKLGWFAWIGSLFSNAFSYIFSLIRMPYDMIFGK